MYIIVVYWRCVLALCVWGHVGRHTGIHTTRDTHLQGRTRQDPTRHDRIEQERTAHGQAPEPSGHGEERNPGRKARTKRTGAQKRANRRDGWRPSTQEAERNETRTEAKKSESCRQLTMGRERNPEEYGIPQTVTEINTKNSSRH